MAQFRFNLQGVLRQRKLIEEQRQRELGEVQARYAVMESQLQAMDREMKSAMEALRTGHLIGPISVEYLASHRRFTIAMQRRAMEHAQKMAEVRKIVEVRRAALVEAAKNRKILEKLRERRQEDWKTHQDRRESAALDEVSQQIGLRLVRAASLENAADEQSVADSAIAELGHEDGI